LQKCPFHVFPNRSSHDTQRFSPNKIAENIPLRKSWGNKSLGVPARYQMIARSMGHINEQLKEVFAAAVRDDRGMSPAHVEIIFTSS
jgi:hypothetical protein